MKNSICYCLWGITYSSNNPDWLRHSVLANMKLDLTPGGQSEGLRGEVWLGDLKYCIENSQFANFNLETQIVNHHNSSSNISDTTSSSSFIWYIPNMRMESRPIVVCVKISSWVRPKLHLPVKRDYLLSIHQCLKYNLQFQLVLFKKNVCLVMASSGSKDVHLMIPIAGYYVGINWSLAARHLLQTTFVPDYTSVVPYLWLSPIWWKWKHQQHTSPKL